MRAVLLRARLWLVRLVRTMTKVLLRPRLSLVRLVRTMTKVRLRPLARLRAAQLPVEHR